VDEAQAPFGGVKQSGAGSRIGGAEANIAAFTELQWVTLRSRRIVTVDIAEQTVLARLDSKLPRSP